MIDSARLKRLLLVATVLVLLASGAALAAGASASFAGGLGVGYLLGALPFASWMWILSRAMQTRRGRILSLLLLAAKLGLYAGLLFVGIQRIGVSPVGILIGLSLVAFVVTLGALWVPAAPLKEAP